MSEIRVNVNNNGTIDLLDFGPPVVDRRGLEQANVPRWVIETISMLRITKEGDLVPDLGFKVSDSLYYIIDREGESNDRAREQSA
jgi:hypothetical protein